MRIGHGYDAHKLVPGNGMTLGALKLNPIIQLKLILMEIL